MDLYLSSKVKNCINESINKLIFVICFVPGNIFLSFFQKEYPLVLSKKQLANEVPYQGGKSELMFYVEGLHFPDKDFDGLLMINLSLLEPVAEVRGSKNLFSVDFLWHAN